MVGGPSLSRDKSSLNTEDAGGTSGGAHGWSVPCREQQRPSLRVACWAVAQIPDSRLSGCLLTASSVQSLDQHLWPQPSEPSGGADRQCRGPQSPGDQSEEEPWQRAAASPVSSPRCAETALCFAA